MSEDKSETPVMIKCKQCHKVILFPYLDAHMEVEHQMKTFNGAPIPSSEGTVKSAEQSVFCAECMHRDLCADTKTCLEAKFGTCQLAGSKISMYKIHREPHEELPICVGWKPVQSKPMDWRARAEKCALTLVSIYKALKVECTTPDAVEALNKIGELMEASERGPLCDSCGRGSRTHYCWTPHDGETSRYSPSENRAKAAQTCQACGDNCNHVASVPLKSETTSQFNSGMSGYVRVPPPALKSETVPTEAAKGDMSPLEQCVQAIIADCLSEKDQEWLPNRIRGRIRQLLSLQIATHARLNSESETVEERAKSTAELLDIFLAKKYGSVEKSPIEVIEALGNVEAYEFAEFVASSLLQEKEQSYKDEREAQTEFYLPQNPTAEDISQARAIIAQQKSKLLEKEQRIKELEARLFANEAGACILMQKLAKYEI